MTTISLNAMSNTVRARSCVPRARALRCRGRRERNSDLGRGFLGDLALDRLAAELGRSLRRRSVGSRRNGLAVRALHPVLEPLHRAAEILPDVAQLLGAEYQDDDQQHDQPVPDAQSAHDRSPSNIGFRQHCAERFGTADDMDMQMHHVLPADATGIDDGTEPFRRALLARELSGKRQHTPENARILGARFGQRSDVLLRHQHEMHRRQRSNVVKPEDLVVLVDFLRRHLAAHNLAEYAVVHSVAGCRAVVTPGKAALGCRSLFPHQLRDAFSSRPDTPSRRSSSTSTSSGPMPKRSSNIRQWNHKSAISAAKRILSPSLAAITASVASSPIFLMIASSPLAKSVAT